ncbi:MULTISPECIES: hypothetical protein [Aphanothece]|uniref:hypothetical protein n=1 Tax=Aphanothece TaxID=1121 RepID=UPI003984AA90
MAAVSGRRGRLISVLACLAAAGWLLPAAQAEPQQALAILLKQLQAKPMGLYDGVRLFRLNQPGGGTLTLTVSCEREQWRVQNSDSAKGQPSFYDTPFLSAKGIGRTWVCTGPARVLE